MDGGVRGDLRPAAKALRKARAVTERRSRYGKLELSWVPAVLTAVTITTAMSEAMSAYSIAVTPGDRA
jgi:hypothetical protein